MTEQEAPLTFPCDMTLKIVGKREETFEQEVLMILHKRFPDLTEGALRQKSSKQGKYLSYSVDVHVISKDQLEAVYLDLKANPHVIFAL